VSQIGAPCPDHLINTKHKPLVVDFDPERDDAPALAETIRRGVADYAAWYRGYYERNLDDETRQFPIDPTGPRVVLVPGVGIVTSGPDAGRARFARDLYHRAIAVEDAADALGGFLSLSESEAFAIEYWPLERYKLAQAPPRGELAGRVAVVTGGASGIGEAVVEAFALQHAQVVFLDIQDDAAAEVIERIKMAGGRTPRYRRCDLAEIEDLQKTAAEVLALHPSIDVLVNNAGNDTRHTLEEVTPSLWDQLMAINLKQQFFMAQAMIPAMRRAGGGSIINMSSISWIIPSTGVPVYVSAKAGIVGMSRTLAHTVGKDNIRVNSVLPGAILTERQKKLWLTETYTAEVLSRQALKRMILPEEVARLVLFLASDDGSAITNQSYVIDGGWV
jgi:NAD(P)-dependent dehydrogenase (short-subunit alcohol dehydrogenase family)